MKPHIPYKPTPEEMKLIIVALEDKIKGIDQILNQWKHGKREMTESQVAFWVDLRGRFNDLLEKINGFYYKKMPL